ncbi:MAG: serine/threonine protein kinase [Sandaracinaceae bacterium]|nr:serine/threonine protein kinase [Sandaracinaceae bacterium]
MTPSVDLSDALAPTLAPEAATLADLGASVTRSTTPTLAGKSTVLPRVEAHGDEIELVHDGRVRYENRRLLGEGGMGTVVLARDHDIDREVALKQIRREVGARGLARFVEEVRTIGRLEHPNIIPIHDVGVDDEGNYFFVMKYVEGETLETVIERLAAGDAEAHKRYTFEVRVQIFIGLLRALSYAHDRGIVHRDVKPANVMVGPYGEVVLMDWGIAKPLDAAELPPLDETLEEPPAAAASSTRRRLVKTAASALVGTPAYMSPEQARGASDLDVRSDLYSACVVFHELMTLRHYLDDVTSVPGMLVGVMERSLPSVMSVAEWSHPTQGPPPAEYMHFILRGMQKQPAARWPSANDMIGELEAALEGRIRVQCPTTFTKRMARESGRFVDRNPRLSIFVMLAAVSLVLFGLVGTVAAVVNLAS